MLNTMAWTLDCKCAKLKFTEVNLMAPPHHQECPDKLVNLGNIDPDLIFCLLNHTENKFNYIL